MRKIAIVYNILILCSFSLSAQPDPILINATTDCGPRGANYRIKWTEEYKHPDLESARRRWGPCVGTSDALCNDTRGTCVSTEAEEALVKNLLRSISSGKCDPPKETLWPSHQTVYDWTLSYKGGRSGVDILRQKFRDMGCSEKPIEEPTGKCPVGQSCQPNPCPVCVECPKCPDIPSIIWVSMATPPLERSDRPGLLLLDISGEIFRGYRLGNNFRVGPVDIPFSRFTHWLEIPKIP